MKLLLKRAKLLSILIMAMSMPGCENNDALLPKIVASFTQTVNEKTGTVAFINISENANNYAWDFGDGTTSTEINPIKTYAAGTYTVSLTASNPAGASDTFEDEITIAIPESIAVPINFDDADVHYDGNISTFRGCFEIMFENV